jgi:hypothetical protein
VNGTEASRDPDETWLLASSVLVVRGVDRFARLFGSPGGLPLGGVEPHGV